MASLGHVDRSPLLTASHLRWIITVGALVVATGHIVWPELSIDGITVTLILVSLVPWLSPLFKSLELPGGWKVEFQDLQRAADRAESVGLLAPAATVPEPAQFTFEQVAREDPNLALAGLRIEIERRLTTLAHAHGLAVERRGIGVLLRDLTERRVLGREERSVLSDMVAMLNQAVHGAEVDSRAADWAIRTGPRLLRALDDRITAVGARSG